MKNTKLTPMFEQYLQIKEEYPDALLFYRMGDFYELFFEDAQIAAKELQITLTSRNPNADVKIPMCGVPHHSVDTYLSKLLEKDYTIAVCDQIEDPKQAKGLVKRAVTRVLTPGTVVEDQNLESKGHNYLASLYWSGDKECGGLAWVEFSTGQWTGFQSKNQNELLQWIQKIQPRELIVPDAFIIPKDVNLLHTRISPYPVGSYFDYSASTRRILQTQNVNDLSVLDLDGKKELVQACGAILAHLSATQKKDPEHLTSFQQLNIGKYLLLDEVTERNLELFRCLDGKTGKGTLLHVLDRTQTPMGGRLLRHRLSNPWKSLQKIEPALQLVDFFSANDSLRAELREFLEKVYDLERLSTRIILGRATPKDILALGVSLSMLPQIHSLLEQACAREERPTAEILDSILKHWDNLDEYEQLIRQSLKETPPPVITEGDLFRQGFNAALDELIELTEHGESKVKELHEQEKKNADLPKLKLGYNRVFGYYFELPRSHAQNAPYHFVRRQTLANSERYTSEQLKQLEDKLVSASERRKSLEYELFLELRTNLAEARPRLLFMADCLAVLDVRQSLAETARKYSWCRPNLHSGLSLSIVQGRHPVVEAVQGEAEFIPNDLHMDERKSMLIITGPNMSGKSTILRQTAIICILAQMGSYIPAQSAQMGLTDRIFSRVGASDNLAQGRSTFMVEMTETARILRQAGPKSLVILDEIGRGTSTYDGLALAQAVVESLCEKGKHGIRTLFATHYHELTTLEGKLPGVMNYNVAVKEWSGDIIFLRKLVPGPSDRSYGIEVAKLAGVPRNVVSRAKELLHKFETHNREGGVMHKENRAVLPGIAGRVGNEAQPQPHHPILKELSTLDPDSLPPIKALMLLQEWKNKWGKTKE